MAYHKKLHRIVPKQVDKLDGSEFNFMAHEVISEEPIITRGFVRPCHPLHHRQDILRENHLSCRLSKSFNDLGALDVIEGIGKDSKRLASLTSDLVENQETLPKPVKKKKKTLCGYFKKLMKQSNTKVKDYNNNENPIENQGSGKSGLNKFKNVSKSVNCLFDKPLYDNSSAQDGKEKLKEKRPKGLNKKKVKAQNKVVSHWLDTGSVLPDGLPNTKSEIKATKKSKGNMISRIVKGDDDESTSSVKTEVLFKQKYGVSSYEIDSDFDGEVTDTTSLPDSEDYQNISSVTLEVQHSAEHDSTQANDRCHSSSPVTDKDQSMRSIREQSISIAEYLQTLPTADHVEEGTCYRPASSDMEGRIKNLRQQVLVVASQRDLDYTKNYDSDKIASSTETNGKISRNPHWSKFLVQSTIFRYPGQCEGSKVTSGLFPHAPAKEVGGECKPVETVWSYLGSF